VYYKEGSGASSQRLQAMWNLCLKLSLLIPSHHFDSIYTNHPLFLVVQVDLILKSHLWMCLSPIPKLQHAFLLTKCYELGSVSQLILGSTFGSLEEFGGASFRMSLWFQILLL
jgi:hypothetical protein